MTVEQFSVSQTPYPGLRSFHRSEFDIFFGRDDHVVDMLEKLTENWFLCVTGPSGCGKSSLARTGLFNAVEAGFLKGRGSDWIFCDLYPETDPLERLCAALAKAIVMGESGRGSPDPGPEEAAQIAELHDLFGAHIETRSSDLTGAVSRVTAVAGRPIVILVDQFEEIFRYGQDDPYAASRFVDVLLKTAAARGDIYVVMTIRTDELEKCARYSGLTGAINHSQFLTPTLDRFQMQEAIEGPITLFGGTIDPQLSIWMLNGLEEQLDKLPLMQHALRLLYLDAREKQPEGQITIRLADFYEVFAIRDFPGHDKAESHHALRTSLSHRLDTIYKSLSGQDQAIARGLFCALTTLESKGRDIRRPIRLSEAAETLGCDLDTLLHVVGRFRDGAEQYLRIVGEHDGIDPGDTVDVAHECVLRLWQPLQESWLPDEHKSAENIRLLAQRARQREEALRGGFWAKILGRDLLSGRTLQQYAQWWSRRKPNAVWARRYLEEVDWPGPEGRLAPDAVFGKVESFFRASRGFANYERLAIGAAAAVLVVLAVVNVAAMVQAARSDERAAQAAAAAAQAKEAAARAAAESAELEAAKQNERANRLAAEEETARVTALASAEQAVVAVNPNARAAQPVEVAQTAADALVRAEETGVGEETLITAYQNVVRAMGYIYEYRRFYHGRGSEAQVFAAEFLPDGERIVTLNEGMDLTIWRLGDNSEPERVIPLAPHLVHGDYDAGGKGRSLAVAPDGTLAVGTQRGEVLLVSGLREGTGEPVFASLFPGLEDWDRDTVASLAFSPDGNMLMAGALTGHVHLWERDAFGWKSTGILLARNLVARQSGVPLEFVTDVGREPRAFSVWSVSFSPDGRRAAMGLENGTVCIFEPLGREVRCDPDGHDAAVKAVRFTRDGETLVSGGNDDRVRIWRVPEVRDGRLALDLTEAVLWHDYDVWDIAFNAGGDLMAVAIWDGSTQIYDTGTWRSRRTLRGHTLTLRTVRFAPEGQMLLTASIDHTARLWTPFVSRVSEIALSDRLPAEETARDIAAVAVAPGGRWVAATNREAIWIKEPGQPISRLYPSVKLPSSFGFLSDLVAPDAGDTFLAARSDPAVMIWTRDRGGAWSSRMVTLTGEAAGQPLTRRRLAVSADGTRFAVNVLGADDEMSVLVCETSALRCGSEADEHAALVPYLREIVVERERGLDCIRPSTITALALSPDGHRLAAGGTDCNLRLYDLDDAPGTGVPAEVMSRHVGNISAADFTPEGDGAVAGSVDWTARLWTFGEARVPQLAGHDSIVTDVVFLPRGRSVATASQDEHLIVWDTGTGKAMLDLPGFTETISALDAAGTDSAALLVAGTEDGDLVAQWVIETPEDAVSFANITLADVRGRDD